ncbi:MAG: hypothetical protein FWF23_03325 [Alphaproteobacteria bacterium]|nr:hypothetical protein [Alphaproteobacteria bacterium]MCL2505662.1 hypothetical protein [Alphaproteobacteria bacterium]
MDKKYEQLIQHNVAPKPEHAAPKKDAAAVHGQKHTVADKYKKLGAKMGIEDPALKQY